MTVTVTRLGCMDKVPNAPSGPATWFMVLVLMQHERKNKKCLNLYQRIIMSAAEKAAIVQSYLNANNLGHVFAMLLYERTLANVRGILLSESINQFRTYLLQSNDMPGRSEYVIKMHAIQLDLISRLFMLLEDYLSYSYLLSIDDISDYLLFKKVDELELNSNDKEFVTKYLNIFSKDIYERVKRIVKFFDNYYRVYIKYKHIFSAIFGIYGIRDDRSIESYIYIRDYLKEMPSTYIIGTAKKL